ncbi:Catalasemono-functionalheme-containing [Penicillium lividum]|nr:Catalasemono-functionalheme-containing [Penicillium lividum]
MGYKLLPPLETSFCVLAIPCAPLAESVVDIGDCAGDQVDKWTRFGFDAIPAAKVEAPLWNIFDMTKVWLHVDFPLRKTGKMTLNRDLGNYFGNIEQAAFSLSNMVPGFIASTDPTEILVYYPFQRDGKMRLDGNYSGDPNYVNSSL